ncbi:MAG: succinate dehydrogenase, hydrophobic membrane anchor protein [Gammaproteobacteria bacterium]|nr:succinate dehydrogenase, hydrophobic membrane anchor protein [Gammaproteobacteria bacterium]MAY01515.1 succinate dehydrogenase, hydrophobic membrane anchor protein [Gammaproteobacteria bacterium]|tara:strand:- start:918 stop:1286 length:369 start_codon:yes stop_codon:yes gene_type:complete
MVTNVTSFGRSGLYDWVVQRVSAVFLLLYILFLVYVFATTPDMQYEDWQALFSGNAMRIGSLIALLSLCAHAWIGMWTIATDYLTPKMLGGSAGIVRFLFELVCLIVLFIYFVWCILILWSI